VKRGGARGGQRVVEQAYGAPGDKPTPSKIKEQAKMMKNNPDMVRKV
jgi:hypothetical protein